MAINKVGSAEVFASALTNLLGPKLGAMAQIKKRKCGRWYVQRSHIFFRAISLCAVKRCACVVVCALSDNNQRDSIRLCANTCMGDRVSAALDSEICDIDIRLLAKRTRLIMFNGGR